MSSKEIFRKRKFEENSNTDTNVNQRLRKNLKTTTINETKKKRENQEIVSQIKQSLDENPLNNEIFELCENMGHLDLYYDALIESNCNNVNEPVNLQRKKTDMVSNNQKEDKFDIELQKEYSKGDQVQNKVYFYEKEEKEGKLYQLHCVGTMSDFNIEKKWSNSNEEEEMAQNKKFVGKPFKSICKERKTKKTLCVFS